MTVIVAALHETGAFVACDSLTTSGKHGAIHRRDCKFDVVTVGRRGRVIVGSAGRASLQPLARSMSAPFEPDDGNPDDLDGWAQKVAEAITANAADANPTLLDDGELDGEILLVHPRRIWAVSADLAIDVGDWYAIGAGDAVALGYLHRAYDTDRTGRTAEWVHGAVGGAAAAACWHTTACGGPVRVAHLPIDGAAPVDYS